MKSLKPGIILLVAALVATVTCVFSGVIPDANTFLLGRILAQGIQQVKNLEDTYEKVREFTDFAKQTKNNIQQMLQMEQDVKKDLATATNIKDFKFSDIDYLFEKNASSQQDPLEFLNADSRIARLLSKMKKAEVLKPRGLQGADGPEFYNLFHQAVDPGLQPDAGSKTLEDQLGFESFLARQHGSEYSILNTFADRFQQQALEIENTVKQDDKFSMTSAERISLLLNAGQLMQKSVELKMKANEVLQMPLPATLRARQKAVEYAGIEQCMEAGVSDSRKASQRMFAGF